MAQARAMIESPPPDPEASIRRDLTHLKVYAIDSEDTEEVRRGGGSEGGSERGGKGGRGLSHVFVSVGRGGRAVGLAMGNVKVLHLHNYLFATAALSLHACLLLRRGARGYILWLNSRVLCSAMVILDTREGETYVGSYGRSARSASVSRRRAGKISCNIPSGRTNKQVLRCFFNFRELKKVFACLRPRPLLSPGSVVCR